MGLDLARLRINKLIVHEVPKKSYGALNAPILSDVESSLTADLRNFFQERICSSLGSAAFEVEFDPSATSPVPELVVGTLASSTGSFVAMSQQIAQHLFNCQTKINPAGLLAVAEATIEQHLGLVILKLEREQGVRVQRELRDDGKVSFNIQHLRDLMLTDKTKVFKVGLFSQEKGSSNSARGLVSDHQRSYRPNTEVADFFLKRFLGCQLREAPGVITKRFYEATEVFINDVITDPATKTRYQIALTATLNSELGVVAPRRFAEEHLELLDRQRYEKCLDESGVSALPFEKDTALIQSRLRKVQMEFTSGLSVIGPSEAFDRHVRVTDTGSRTTRLEIEDIVKRVQGR